MHLSRAHRLMTQALAEGMFSAGVLLVIREEKEIFHEPYGRLGSPGSAPATRQTLFDLASLTKILATTPSWMILAREQPGIIDECLQRWFPDCPGEKQDITVRHLLAHASGLPAWRPYYLMKWSVPVELNLLKRILEEPSAYSPGRSTVYSDLGFILLSFALYAETGQRLDQFARSMIYEPLAVAQDLTFLPVGNEWRTALTRQGDPPGLVNDLNTRILGGVSGHAGLFGTAKAVSLLAQETLGSLTSDRGFFDVEVTKTFCRRAGFTTESTRALGFDTPSVEGSSSGRLFSQRSLGHTGFTGTSLWMDPDGQRIVVLLTNRVFMGEADQRMKSFRPVLHDAVMKELV